MTDRLTKIKQRSNGLLDTKQASDFLGVNDKSLANSRYTGTGIQIPFIKMGKIVRYRQSDLEAYIEKNTFTHTGEVRGLLDIAASTEKNTLTHTGEVKGLLD
jgi:hypothetical protein